MLPVANPVVWSRTSDGSDVDPRWRHYDFGSFFSITVLPRGSFEQRFYYDDVHVFTVDVLPTPMRLAWNSDRIVDGFGGVDHVTRYPTGSELYFQADQLDDCVVITVDAGWMERNLPDAPDELQCSHVPKSSQACRELSCALAAGEGDWLAIEAFVGRLVREAHAGPSRSVSEPAGLSVPALRRVEGFVRETHPRDVSVASMAEAAGLSYFSFIRRFRRASGMTPHQYLLGHRVARARSLLADDRLSLAEVALRSGFASQSHLTGVFRGRLGTTPGRYRAESHRGDGSRPRVVAQRVPPFPGPGDRTPPLDPPCP